MTTWAENARAAIVAGEQLLDVAASEISDQQDEIVALKAQHDADMATIKSLQDQLGQNPPPPPPPAGSSIFGFAGPDPTGKAKVKRVYLDKPTTAFPNPEPGVTHIVTYKGTNHAERAKQVKAYGKPIYFGWTHEPENGANNISAATYVVEWNKFAAALKAEGVTNVQRIWCLMSATFDSPKAATYYPGDLLVDVVAADGYDWCGCRDTGDGTANPNGSHRSMGTIFGKVVNFAKLHTKRVAFLEYGTPALRSGDEKARAAWINDAVAWCKSKPSGVEVVAATYFQHDTSDGFRCDWTLKGASLDAYKAAL